MYMCHTEIPGGRRQIEQSCGTMQAREDGEMLSFFPETECLWVACSLLFPVCRPLGKLWTLQAAAEARGDPRGKGSTACAGGAERPQDWRARLHGRAAEGMYMAHVVGLCIRA